MASTLSGPNIEEEYMWSCTLSRSNKEYEWAPKEPQDNDTEDEEDGEDVDPTCKPNHRLLIKQAILHPEAVEGEVTMLQVETIGYNKQKVVAPIVAMKAGNDLQKYIDLLVPDTAKIKVISGSGPVSLIGSHCVDFYDYRNYGAGQDDEDDEEEDEDEEAASSEDDAVDMEEQEAAAPPPAKGKSPKKASPTKEDKKKSPGKAEDKKKSPSKAEDKESSPPPKSAEKTTPGKKGKKGDEPDEAVKPASAGKKDKKRKASDEDGEGKKKRKGSDK